MQQRRPGFPARIPLASGAGKPVAAPPVRVGASQAMTVSTELGLDSVAVRARMVRRLGAAGITMPKDLALVPGDGFDAFAHFFVGHDDDFVRLQAAGRGSQACGFQNALDLVLRHGLGGVHFFGGIAPLQALDEHVRWHFLGRGVEGRGVVH